jgi:hypothetical protein
MRPSEDVLSTLSNNAGGLFLLPALQIQIIVDQVTKSDIRAALRSLSFNIYEVFESSFQRIQNQSGSRQQVAMNTLMWISYARRPLTINELRHALATHVGDRELDMDNMVPVRSIIEGCSGLVVIDHESSTVRLVHFSLQEYLQVRRQALFPGGDSVIAMTCLTYLSFAWIEAAFRDKDTILKRLIEEFPLLDYSSHFWGYHAKATLTVEVRELAMCYLKKIARIECAARIRDLKSSPYVPKISVWRYLNDENALHCVSYFGLHELIPPLIQRGVFLQEFNTHGNEPLHEAVCAGEVETAAVLLEHGANVNSYNEDGYTPLALASSLGNEKLIKLLLRHGANPDMSQKDDWTALHFAADHGHLGAVKLLLDLGCSKNSKSSRGLTALNRAAGRGHTDVVALLLERGCRANATSWDGWTPLHGVCILFPLPVSSEIEF